MDEELILAARTVMEERYVEGRHQVGAAVRTRSGSLFAGVHVGVRNGRITVCAEAVAIGAAATAGDTDLAAVVAVTESGDVIPPCGMCREMIHDYAPGAVVYLEKPGQLRAVPIEQLLPESYDSAAYPNRRKG